MTALRFTLPGAPRTKKTSSRIVKIGKFNKILPSEAHEEWFKEAMAYALPITAQLRRAGAVLPIQGDVEVEAIFYREALVGDLLGYEQALADWMQTERWSKAVPGKPSKRIRKGAGIIVDDVQIVSWDGSRLAKDAANPRIEVTIYPLEGQLDLTEAAPQHKYPVIGNV